MTKRIQLVRDLLMKARRNPDKLVKSQNYSAMYFTEPNEGLVLEHYGTKIFQVDLDKGMIVRLGGFSFSDRDAISTAMELMGFDGFVSNSKSYMNKGYLEMDGWYIVR